MSPGPGTYKTQTAMGEGPTYVLGARLLVDYDNKNALEQPSPNLYNPKFEVLSKTHSIFSIGRAKR